MDTVDTRSASVPEDGEKIIEIQLERLRTFKNHPFKVRMDQEMIRLSASVEKYGIINPLIVRPIPDGVYEIISGHRRKAAAEKFGYRKVPVIIRVMSDDEAVINMVDSNLQREQITFSEKAFAYKMKNEAMKRTGGRRKSSQSDYPLKGKKTVEIIGEEFGDSAKQVQRYLKLTDLIPELLEKLDNGELSFNPAVELSYLTIEEQKEFIDAMEYTQAVPSISQAQRMKKLSREKKLTGTKMREIMGEIKKGAITRVILSLCELIVGGKTGLEPVEKTIIDRCVRLVYQEYLADPVPEKMPVLEDLYDLLRKQDEPEAQRLATALEIYVTGSLNVFNHRTNVDINNRIVCFDIKELGKQLKKIGMLIVQDQVWNRVTINRSAHKSTRYYIDEFHLLLKEEQTASYSVEIWKRFRKWGGIPTGITQNIKDLLASREIENIFENSDFIYMLNQASGDRQILAKQLNISPTQLSYVTNSNEGEGLLFYGNVIIPFIDHFPKNSSLYRIMTTKPEEQEV